MRISKKVVAQLRNRAEQACTDMADVCELAHKRTVHECKKKNIQVDVVSRDGVRYSARAQRVFDRHYDGICERTGI